MPEPMPHTAHPGSSRTFREKLGIYMLGIGIGLVLLGWFQVKKQQAARATAEAQRAAASDQTPASDEPAATNPSPPADPGG